MSIVDDVLKVLDRNSLWKRLHSAPDEIEALKQRCAALEEKLGGKWPADVCRFCGEQSARLQNVFGSVDAKGNVREWWRCEACGNTDDRFYKPSSR